MDDGVREATSAELERWDATAVDGPGGHVLQSRAWAAHRQATGWTPHHLVTADGMFVLAVSRSWPFIGGGSAYLPRGPVADVVDPERLADRLAAVTAHLAGRGIDVVASDAEIPAETGYGGAIESRGFHAIEEIQPSRHRVSLPLGGGADEAAAFDAIAKSTRQRVRGAERDGITVVRHDTRQRTDGAGEGFVAPTEPAETALDRFYDLLLETGERRHFSFGPRSLFVRWWRAAYSAGHLVYLEARAPDPDRGQALAGLVLYRHGGRLSTVHSGDHASSRSEHPVALHLLRWRAIQLAIREGCSEMDLGGVDVAGARGEPREGDPLYGLYQHKRAFGGRWLALTGAHERIFDARGYALGRLTGRIARLARR
jgi:lipid II:glycine glycyltransferase (peptidoglycan interpeptide bridge formation enzyme)